ncbi:MAG: hypothetical protein Q4E81_02415 [Succinatimonas sp.]|nr:hypothetical protein [Succinatimonas sp.]
MKLSEICKATLLANLCLSSLALADTLYPQDFGGAPDNKTLNTVAIQTAIDKCASAGGGEVRLSNFRHTKPRTSVRGCSLPIRKISFF